MAIRCSNPGSWAFSDQDVDVDLPSRQATQSTLLTSEDLTIGGFRDVTVNAVDVTLQGTGRPEHLVAQGCSAQLDGGAGADHLRFFQRYSTDDTYDPCPDPIYPATQVRGGGGDDVLVGDQRFGDDLVGGPGPDRADGRGGTDTCDAEVEVSCEQ